MQESTLIVDVEVKINIAEHAAITSCAQIDPSTSLDMRGRRNGPPRVYETCTSNASQQNLFKWRCGNHRYIVNWFTIIIFMVVTSNHTTENCSFKSKTCDIYVIKSAMFKNFFKPTNSVGSSEKTLANSVSKLSSLALFRPASIFPQSSFKRESQFLPRSVGLPDDVTHILRRHIRFRSRFGTESKLGYRQELTKDCLHTV